MNKSRLNLIWCDAEFTSLDIKHNAIMQIAMVITTPELDPILPPGRQDFPNMLVAITQEQADHASDWVRENQAALLARCREAGAIPLAEVETELRKYVLDCCEVPTQGARNPEEANNLRRKNPVLAGNSVYNDYQVIERHLPALADLLSYRLVDASCIKELVRRWQPSLEFDKTTMAADYLPPSAPSLEGEKHDALYDVWCSIAELRYYRKVMFGL